MQTTTELLTERGSTHGNFTDNSKTAQQIKSVMRRGANWNDLAPHQAEALDMIAHKIGRILAGDYNFLDHWADLTGYGQLVVDRLKPETK